MEQSELYIKLDRLTTLVEAMWLAGKTGDIKSLDEYHNEANPLGFEMMRLMEQKGLDSLVVEDEEKKPLVCAACVGMGWYGGACSHCGNTAEESERMGKVYTIETDKEIAKQKFLEYYVCHSDTLIRVEAEKFTEWLDKE